MLVHGEQGVTLHRPDPGRGRRSTLGREIVGIYDKGKAAVVRLETDGDDVAGGEPLFTTRSSAFIRGEGGWGGDRGPVAARRTCRPSAAPDHEVTYATRPTRRSLYRLCGDRNPLHSDPAFAALAGFDRPILHGLCTLRLHRPRAAARAVRLATRPASSTWRAGSRRR